MVANMIANQKKKGLKSSKSYAADKKKSKKSENKTKRKTRAKSDANKEIGRDIGRSQKNKKIEMKEDDLELPNSSDEENMSEEDLESEIKLPSVESDAKLQKLVRKSQEVEKASEEAITDTESKSDFLSISTPAEDGEVPKVPSYSHQKNRGVIYLSHVPHGFYEKQMREFFGQFGVVTNLRLGRSKRTGKSCGFAFVEFKYKEVAKVVSETMNNYLMFDKILKCSLVPQERVSPAIFKCKIRPHKVPGKASRIASKKVHNSVKSEETVAKRQVRQVKKMNKTLKKLKEAGIEYNFKIAEMSG